MLMQESVSLRVIDISLISVLMFLIGASTGAWLAWFINKDDKKENKDNVNT